MCLQTRALRMSRRTSRCSELLGRSSGLPSATCGMADDTSATVSRPDTAHIQVIDLLTVTGGNGIGHADIQSPADNVEAAMPRGKHDAVYIVRCSR